MRYMVVDFADRHAVVDTDGPASEECDHGTVVWTGEAIDRKDGDAQWASARQAEVECSRRNVEDPLSRPRPEPGSTQEAVLDSVPATAEAHGAEV